MGKEISTLYQDTSNNTSDGDSSKYEYDYDFDSPRFSVNNNEEIQEGVTYLENNGYAVFRDILSKDEVVKCIDLFWDYLASLETGYPIDRNDPETWNYNWPGSKSVGLVNTQGIGQSEFMWTIRGNPNVKKVFSRVWNSNELAVSFDGAGCFRDWHLNSSWKTEGNWFHCDQNPLKNPDRCSIQGLVSLTDGNKSTGSLVVIPGSFKRFHELAPEKKSFMSQMDYIEIPENHSIIKEIKPRVVNCKAGDLVLWDSRSIHCNTPGIEEAEPNTSLPEAKGLLRLVAYVCMSPVSMFKPNDVFETFEEYVAMRKKCIARRMTCTHWPLRTIFGRSADSDRLPLKLNKFQQSLINGENVEYDPESEKVEF